MNTTNTMNTINTMNAINTKNTTNTHKILNWGIVAHVDAGKTTLTEQLLYHSGAIRGIGRVDDGNTVTDNMTLEKERGITIRSSTVSFNYLGNTINLLDTPGHVDFVAEVERSLSVLDGAILAISAREGVQVQTRVIFNALRRLNIPTLIVINKVDRMGVSMDALYADIKKDLTDALFLINGVKEAGSREAKLTSSENEPSIFATNCDVVAMQDLDFLDAYYQASEATEVAETAEAVGAAGVYDSIGSMLTTTAQALFNQGKLFPVLHASALHGLGVESILEAMVTWLDMPQIACEGDLSARVYKINHLENGHRLCYTRIFKGGLMLRKAYPLKQETEMLKVSNLFKLDGAKLVACGEAVAGEVVVLMDRHLKIESIIGEPPAHLPKLSIATPTLKATVRASDLGQRRAICEALDILTDEDPFLDYAIHPVTELIEVKLFGTVQSEIIEALLRTRFDIDTVIEPPKTIYKERPKAPSAACIYMYKDGNHLPATVGIEIEPLPEGSGFVYTSGVSLGDLMKPFQNAVEEGIETGLRQGLKGWAVTDIHVKFVISEYNSVDSTPADYRKLAPEVLKQALQLSDTECLEPIMSFELEVPQYAIGRAISDVLRMRGRFDEPTVDGDTMRLTGYLPLETSKDYIVELSDYTEGKGMIRTTFYRYELCTD